RLIPSLFSIEGGSEAARALLVHLGPRRNTIDGHEEKFLWLDLAEKVFYVVEDSDEHFVLGHPEGRRVGVLVCTIVDDTIHVEVETVELGNAILGDELRYGGI